MRTLTSSMLMVMCLLVFGCNGVPDETNGVPGDGGSGGTEATMGGGGGVGGSGSSGGGAPEPTIDEQLINGFPKTPVELAACEPFEPTANDDGGYARVVFGPFVDGWTSSHVRWLAASDETFTVPQTWRIAWMLAASIEDAASKDCTELSFGVDVQAAEPVDGVSVVESHNVAPTEYKSGEVLVLCVQQDADVLGFGHPTGMLMCGAPGSSTDRDQWDNGVVTLISEYMGAGAQPRRWAVEFVRTP